MFQLTTLAAATECERHAPSRAGASMLEMAHHGHQMARNHAPANAPRSPEAPTPKCCMVAGNCATGAFASIVTADEASPASDVSAPMARDHAPTSPSRAPEPPPPKA